jgi:hypothetical protein
MGAMTTWTARTSVSGDPDEILELPTELDGIRSWAPIPFEVTALPGDRLEAGSAACVRGGLAGRSVSFDVEYDVRPAAAGSEVEASVAVSAARGLVGRLLGRATDAMLAAGALSSAVDRLGQQFEPALAA